MLNDIRVDGLICQLLLDDLHLCVVEVGIGYIGEVRPQIQKHRHDILLF